MAQLGARFHGMEEVKGSNPFRSTKFQNIDESFLRIVDPKRLFADPPNGRLY